MGVSSLVVSCEHGGHAVPAALRHCFVGARAVLASHRGWDPGALPLAAQMAQAFAAPLFAATTTRLVIDLNRSLGHRQLFSEFTRGLPRAEREAIVAAHYRPHRDRVEGDIARRIGAGEAVTHIASHSFTPVLSGTVRQADVAWLYDPRREREAALALRWMACFALHAPRTLHAPHAPQLRLRRNYPYQGRGDGLASLLRKRFGGAAYRGIELEVNQRFVIAGGAPWAALRGALVASLAQALDGTLDGTLAEPLAEPLIDPIGKPPGQPTHHRRP